MVLQSHITWPYYTYYVAQFNISDIYEKLLFILRYYLVNNVLLQIRKYILGSLLAPNSIFCNY